MVILQHSFASINQPIFTLYAHLSKVSVKTGDVVKQGEEIGLVGSTGTAVGSHLHFEVRFGENLYANTRNPELWLKPHTDTNGQANGAIAGRILDEFGEYIYIPDVVIERLSNNGTQTIQTYYIETYADRTVNGDNAFKENFAIGDLPPGKYRVTFVARGLQKYVVNVYPQKVTLILFDANKTGENQP